MIKLDLEKLNWVEDALIKWSNKLGRREIVLLEKDMYTKHSMAKRKRVKIDVDKPEDYFDFDENGNFVVNSKLLHLFIFFWDQKVETASSKDAMAFERHNEVDLGRAPSSQILYRPVLADHSNVPDLCNGPVSTTSNTSNTHAHDFEEVNEIIEKCGCLSPSLWSNGFATILMQLLREQQICSLLQIHATCYCLLRSKFTLLESWESYCLS